MNPQVKQLWIGALRSGTYKQGRERLRTGDKFCCLGVLCDLYDKAHHPDSSLWTGVQDGVRPYNGEAAYLPPNVVTWSGLKDHLGSIENDSTVSTSLAQKNDAGVPFEAIADVIEAKF